MTKCPYWSTEALKCVDRAQSFVELGQQSVEVIGTFPKSLFGRVAQVCGPVSTGGFNSPKINFRVLAGAVRHLREGGITVFDQTPLENNILRLWEKWKSDPANATSEYCWPILYDVYRPIFLSGVIGQLYFLPGWDKSVGSAWERSQGLAFKMKILDYPEHLYRKILEEHNLVSA